MNMVTSIEAVACEWILQDGHPPVLLRHAQAQKTNREYSSAGRLAQPMELSDLDPGRYPYLINDQNQLIYSPAIPDYTVSLDNRGLAIVVSHRSLDRWAENNSLSRHYVAAGEFLISETPDSSGRLVKLVEETNNRSSTFRGQQQHLFYGNSVLAQYGLPIQADTALVDHSLPPLAGKDPHALATDNAFYEILYRGDSRVQQMDTLIVEMRELFPNRLQPRGVDASLASGLSDLVPQLQPDRNLKRRFHAVWWSSEYFGNLDEYSSAMMLHLLQRKMTLSIQELRNELFQVFQTNWLQPRSAEQ